MVEEIINSNNKPKVRTSDNEIVAVAEPFIYKNKNYTKLKIIQE